VDSFLFSLFTSVMNGVFITGSFGSRLKMVMRSRKSLLWKRELYVLPEISRDGLQTSSAFSKSERKARDLRVRRCRIRIRLLD
jgi:hypothetical protein